MRQKAITPPSALAVVIDLASRRQPARGRPAKLIGQTTAQIHPWIDSPERRALRLAGARHHPARVLPN